MFWISWWDRALWVKAIIEPFHFDVHRPNCIRDHSARNFHLKQAGNLFDWNYQPHTLICLLFCFRWRHCASDNGSPRSSHTIPLWWASINSIPLNWHYQRFQYNSWYSQQELISSINLQRKIYFGSRNNSENRAYLHIRRFTNYESAPINLDENIDNATDGECVPRTMNYARQQRLCHLSAQRLRN